MTARWWTVRISGEQVARWTSEAEAREHAERINDALGFTGEPTKDATPALLKSAGVVKGAPATAVDDERALYDDDGREPR